MDILDRINNLPPCVKTHLYREYVLPGIIQEKIKRQMLLWKFNECLYALIKNKIYLTKTINII
jgi:hypothetical protein